MCSSQGEIIKIKSGTVGDIVVTAFIQKNLETDAGALVTNNQDLALKLDDCESWKGF